MPGGFNSVDLSTSAYTALLLVEHSKMASDYKLSGVAIIICIALGVMGFVQVFIFAKRQIMRFTLRTKHTPHFPIGYGFPKHCIESEVDRRLLVIKDISFEPRLLDPSDDSGLRERSPKSPSEESRAVCAPHIYRMKAMDAFRSIECPFRLCGDELRITLLRRASSDAERSALDTFVTLYERARFSEQEFGPKELEAYLSALDAVRPYIERAVNVSRGSTATPSRGSPEKRPTTLALSKANSSKIAATTTNRSPTTATNQAPPTAQSDTCETQISVLKCKLDSKTEALLILTRDLEETRTQRDQYKLMSEQLRERYSTLKKRIDGWSLAKIVCEMNSKNKAFKRELELTQQKLRDADDDVKMLREQLKCDPKRRASSFADRSPSLTAIGEAQLDFIDVVSTREREKLVTEIEALKTKCAFLERDLQSVLDEKEELITARDAHRARADRLTQQLNTLLTGSSQMETPRVDVDALMSENRYFRERLQLACDEKQQMLEAIAKLKAFVDKKKSVGLRAPYTPCASNKQVQQLYKQYAIQVSSSVPEVKHLISTILESLNDKTIALNHARKIARVLGKRVTDLDAQIRNFRAEIGARSDKLTSVLAPTDVASSSVVTTSVNATNSTVQPDISQPPQNVPSTAKISRSESSRDSEPHRSVLERRPSSPILKNLPDILKHDGYRESSPNESDEKNMSTSANPDDTLSEFSRTPHTSLASEDDVLEEELTPELKELIEKAMHELDRDKHLFKTSSLRSLTSDVDFMSDRSEMESSSATSACRSPI